MPYELFKDVFIHLYDKIKCTRSDFKLYLMQVKMILINHVFLFENMFSSNCNLYFIY